MDGYNYHMKCELRDAQLPWWRNRFEGMWGLLLLTAIGVSSFATIVLFNGALPTILGE